MIVTELPRVAPQLESLFANKEELQEIVAQQFDAMGWEYDPAATAEDSHRAMLAEGIRPEDNFLSRAIIAAREE